jgi:hypothetical protein
MSELAFNLNGEPFDLPLTATGWRVRKFKSKGAPEVVYGREGTPLVLPIDADMADLRREARSEGRYRLDAIDESNRPIAGAPPAYVCIHPSEVAPAPSAPEPAPVRNQPPPGPDYAVIEAMRVNSDLARTVITQFPQMLESAAVLLRAADAAGMADRPPRPFTLVAADDVADDDEAEPEAPARPGGVMGFLGMLLEKVSPEIVTAILTGKLRVPGGLGAMLDGRRAATASADAETQARSTPGVEPAPGRRVPAPAASSPAAYRAPAAAAAASGVKPGTARATAESAQAAAAMNLPANLPTIEEADMAHFMNILRALTMREAMYAQALAGELSPDELRAWIGELKQMAVPEAVAKIRTVLGTDADTSHALAATDAPAGSTGGVS